MTDIEKKAAEAAEQYAKPIENIRISDKLQELVRQSHSRGFIAGYTARAEESLWRPISEAPKDETVWCYEAGKMYAGEYGPRRAGDGAYQWFNLSAYTLANPTHFMPLPQPPTAQP